MKRKISLVIAIVGLISFIAGGSLLFKSLTASRDEYESLKASIVTDYENFKVKIESFSEERTNIYEGLNKITYLTDVEGFKKYANLIVNNNKKDLLRKMLMYRDWEDRLSKLKKETRDKDNIKIKKENA